MNKETLPQINVGETIRMARERTGQDLRYVADMLRIRYVYLEAIEKGEYQKLPGATYAIGFVRAYADHLNLNSVQIVERFKQERDDLDQQTQLVFPKPLPEGKVPSGGILLVAVVLGVLVYGAWFFLSGQDKPIAELIPEIPARLMALVGVGEDDESEPEETAPAITDGDDQGSDAGETVIAEPTEDVAIGDEPAGAGEIEEDAVDAASAPDVSAEDLPMSGETAATTDTMLAPDAAETAEPAAEETAAEADAAAPGTDDVPAAAEEPVSEPAAETGTTEAVPAAPAEAATQESAVEETADEPDAAEEPVTAQTTDAPAEPAVVAEPEDAADPQMAADTTSDSDGETPVAATTSQADTRAPSASDTTDSGSGDDDAAALAQRVLEELGRTDTPAEATASPATAGAPANGGSVSAEAPAADVQQPTGELPVASITPAARTRDAPTAIEPRVSAPGNGAGSVSPSIVPGRSGGKTYGVENARSRIRITARVDSWVEVSTQQGELLLTRVLRAGDSFRVPDQAGLQLVTGNAGGLAISVDGAQVPDLGPVGAVRRGVELDPDRLKAGTAGNL